MAAGLARESGKILQILVKKQHNILTQTNLQINDEYYNAYYWYFFLASKQKKKCKIGSSGVRKIASGTAQTARKLQASVKHNWIMTGGQTTILQGKNCRELKKVDRKIDGR